MASRISNAPSPRTFSEAFRREVLDPAERQLGSGQIPADPDLDGAAALVKDAARAAAGTAVSDFIAAQAAEAEAAVERAAGPDGRLSTADSARLPSDMRLAYHYLKTGELPQPAAAASPARYSANVMRSVLAAYGLSDEQALVQKALTLDDGNGYLNRSELEAAAAALRADAVDLTQFRFSDSVVDRVMTKFNLGDRKALLREATKHDADGNRYLKQSELEAAAKVLTGQLAELGIISDIDKTVLPPERPGGLLPPPYPGIKQLLHELDGQKPGDVHYVTARDPASVAADNVPGWMANAGLPDGSIDTGVSPLPWVARPEKVKDISKWMDANPGQDFVLFGDNSHQDHNVYSDIIAKYPGRIKAAFIHTVKNRPGFQPPAGMYMIDNYADAAKVLKDLKVLDDAAARRVMVAAQVEGLQITDAEIDALLS